MIFEANIISSASISEKDFLNSLKEFGAEIALESDGSLCAEFHRDVFTVVARMLDANFDCYEEAKLTDLVRAKLGGEMRTLITLEFSEGVEAQIFVVTIGEVIADRWPIVLDNGRGQIYGRDELRQFGLQS